LDIIKILIASNELSLQELITNLQSFLIENKKTWMEQNFGLIYKTSFADNSFLKLQNFCTEFMSKEPEKVFNSIDFTSISENCLISLIQHDNYEMNVIQVWEHILKWGIAQNPELPSDDPLNYSKDNFDTLKNTLQQCIPFIKLYNLTSKEFLDKIYPYKKIIPKELRENLIKYYLNNDVKPIENSESNTITKEISSKSIDSRIIIFKHAELISKWIEKLEISDQMINSYDFKLIFRGSRDGFSYHKFHEICDNKPHTISIIKVKDSNEILGGYNPIIWKSDDSYGATKDSFIFSFKNNENIEDYILSRVKNEKSAIYNNPDYGPTFAYDLVLRSSNRGYRGYCIGDNILNYKKPIREIRKYFTVEEYEIFQIMKD
jgi:hypothetical protein